MDDRGWIPTHDWLDVACAVLVGLLMAAVFVWVLWGLTRLGLP